jgi:hypothetical protein
MKPLAWIVPACFALVACAADGDSADGSDTGSESDGGGGDGSTDGDGADDGADGGSGDGGSDDGATDDGGSGNGDDGGSGDDGDATLAKGGIMLTKVTSDQGVAVDIGADGIGVPVAQRDIPLVQNRATLIRAMWTVPPDWEAREIKGRITLHFPNGTEEEASKTMEIAEDAIEGQIDEAFFWYLPPEFIVPGLEYEVTLEEVDDSHDGEPDGSNPPRLPYDGTADVGIEDSYMIMKVLLIPVQHELEGRDCDPAPVPTEDEVEAFRAELHAFNPTERVEVEVRDTFLWTQSMSSFNPLLSALSQLRGPDDAPPEQYYYGLVDPCDGGPMNVGGQAIGIPNSPTVGNAWQRVAVGRFEGTVNSEVGTFVHEIGHTQGRRHVLCSGQEDGYDPTYPYPGGDIGGYGFNIESWVFMSPNLKEYMSYCGPAWVSDFGWNQVYPVIETLSSWDGGRAAVGSILVGAVYPDGNEEWWTTTGAVDSADLTPGHAVEFHAADGSVERLPAMATLRPESNVLNVAVPMPSTFDQVTEIVRTAPGMVQVIDRQAIRVLHVR